MKSYELKPYEQYLIYCRKNNLQPSPRKDFESVSEWIKKGFSLEGQQLSKMSSVADYLVGTWKHEAGIYVSAKAIYSAYLVWRKDNGYSQSMNPNRFGREASKILGKSRTVCIKGQRVRGYEAVEVDKPLIEGHAQIEF